MSYVFQRNGAWFLGYLNEAGRQVRVKSPVQTQLKAKKLAAQLEEKAGQVRMGFAEVTRKPHTWAEACQRYLDDAVPNLRSPGPARSYINHYLAKAFKGRFLHEMQPGECEAWTRTHLKGLKGDLSPGSREQVRVRGMAIYSWAAKLGWVTKEKNPWSSWRVRLDKHRPKFLSEEEVRAVLLGAPERHRNLFAVALYCGLRKGELAGLLWENVDLDGGSIRVCRSYDGATKSGRERAVTIPPECLPFVMAQRERTTGPLVFPAPRGQMYGPSWSASREFKEALAAVGVTRTDVTFRSQRSTFGTHFTQQTGDLTATQDTLGHSNPAITRASYAAAIPEHRARQARRFTYGLTPGLLPDSRGRSESRSQRREEAPQRQWVEGSRSHAA